MSHQFTLKSLVCIATLGLSVCGAVQADDAGVKKDPLPDSLSLGGITVYATVDVGYAYQSKGTPLNSRFPGGLEYQAFTTTRNFAGSQSTLAESGLEQSRIGIRVDQPIGNGINIVGRLETGFNPLSAQLTDACASIAQNSGVPQGKQTTNADSSRCGQAFNSVAYGGVSNKTFGTLTIGRHNALLLDALVQYDPQALSYAFSFLGYSGFTAGSGSTQAARWDNSAKYAYQNGPMHAAVMYSNGGADAGIFGKSYGVDLGATIQGLSIDAIYQKENGAVNLRSALDNGANPIPTPGLAAYVSNDQSYSLLGKYIFDLGGGQPGPSDKITVYAGYSHIEKANSSLTGPYSQGEYPIDIGITINATAVYNLEFVGAKYSMASGWNFTASYVHTNQNSWTIGVVNGPQGLGCSAAGLLCAGDFNEEAIVADYVFNKHYDVYAGINHSEVTDGLANGFQGTTSDGTTGSESQTTVMIGFRVKL